MKILNLVVAKSSAPASNCWQAFAASSVIIQLAASEEEALRTALLQTSISVPELEAQVINAGDVEETFLYLIGFSANELGPLVAWVNDKGKYFSTRIAAILDPTESIKSLTPEEIHLMSLVFPWFATTGELLQFIHGSEQKPDGLARRQAIIADTKLRSPA